MLDETFPLILMGSSGQSPNILNGAKQAREMGLLILTPSGFRSDNPLRILGRCQSLVDSIGFTTS